MIKGSCECGQVRFQFETSRERILVCHCTQCRKISGHLWAATFTEFDAIEFLSDAGLTWYSSSDWAERGFCKTCGSSLFYSEKATSDVGVAVGSLDEMPDSFHIAQHVFAKDKGTYYEITDGAEIFDAS